MVAVLCPWVGGLHPRADIDSGRSVDVGQNLEAK